MIRNFPKLKEHTFDLLVAGGGIYGAWTAYDAALRGLKVAIIDRNDWAGATSSASSKLIHGGLRYLETYDFQLVRKSLRERQMLMSAAPHRVWPLRFGVPSFADSRLGGFRLALGLTVYDFLAGLPFSKHRYRRLTKSEFSEHFPKLDDINLQGGFTYYDAQTDDARFVLELIDGAQSAGAVCVNYCELTSYCENDHHVCGAIVVDTTTRQVSQITAKQVVNASGQWLATIGQCQDWCRLSKGVHLVMPNMLRDEALLLTAKQDGRVFFMIPWYGFTLLGTTDTDYNGDIDHVAVEQSDIDYLLIEANHVLKTPKWSASDIIGQFAGVRVLKKAEATSPSALSRDWELKILANGVLVSVGGKFTSARQDAALIVDKVCANLQRNEICRTYGRKFAWSPKEDYKSWMESVEEQALQFGIDQESAFWLMRRHGVRVKEIFRLIRDNPDFSKRILPTAPFIIADLVFSARHEMVIHLDDLLRRRMPLAILVKLTSEQIEELAYLVANELAWDEKEVHVEIEQCCKQFHIETG